MEANNDVVDVVEKDSNSKDLMTECMISYPIFSIFREYLDLKFYGNNNLDNDKIREELDHVILVGVNQCRKNIQTTTSSTSLLFKGKKPRKDVLVKLAKIAAVYFDDPVFPHFRPLQIRNVVVQVLDRPDKRTRDDYLQCIKDYSIPDRQRGTFDVSSFCRELYQHQHLIKNE